VGSPGSWAQPFRGLPVAASRHQVAIIADIKQARPPATAERIDHRLPNISDSTRRRRLALFQHLYGSCCQTSRIWASSGRGRGTVRRGDHFGPRRTSIRNVALAGG
jgi:hypothetical protein